jgi:hypothetical protein
MPSVAPANRIGAIAVAALGAVAALAVGAQAQSTFGVYQPPLVSGTRGLAPIAPKPAFGATSGAWAQLHHDAYGGVCIKISGYSEAQKTDPEIFNHMLLIANACSMTINLHICYYQSEHCIDVAARPYDRTLETLGIFPHMQDFRWAYVERFN